MRVALDDRIPTMGVFASGRMLANPHFVRKLKQNELVFVLAHELLHLALRTHDRAKGSDRLEFNYAHDYIINDILRNELGFDFIPANGLDMPGARDKSAEEIVLDMRGNAHRMQSKTRVFDGESTTVGRMFGPGGETGSSGAGRKQKANGDSNDARDDAGDVLDEAREKRMFPEDADEQDAQADRIKEVAAKGLALGKAIGAMKSMRGMDAGGQSQVVNALRGLYRTPWEMALQRWIESVAPGERTFVRPSRRGTERTDVVLPGRRREGWILNVVLDTSGSMTEEMPRALGAIADFCDSIAIDQVRLVQCDAAVTADEMLSPLELARWRVSGYGGSDVSPAMLHLAEDPHVRAVIVITDGDIAFSAEPPPYQVLWVLPPNGAMSFRPRYGHVIVMQQG